MSKAKLAPATKSHKVGVSKSGFILYRVSCHGKDDPTRELVDLEISPFAVLVAATAIKKESKEDIQTCMGTAYLRVLDSIEQQFTILAVTQK